MPSIIKQISGWSRRAFIGGSDARIIMGRDEAALIRLWLEKRGETGPEDLSGNLVVQLGTATEDLNRAWYERNAGRRVRDVQRWVLCHEHRRSTRRCATVREMKAGPSGSAIRSLIPSHRELLRSKAVVVSVAETSGL
jgi:predicted phage-related endonuclease